MKRTCTRSMHHPYSLSRFFTKSSPQPPPPPPPKKLSTAYRRVFRYFDEDGDGKISPAELRNCMMAAGEELALEAVEAVVMSRDSDGDGMLGFDDLMKLVVVDVEAEEEERALREAFLAYEMDGRGCITPKSLCRRLRRLGESKTVEECKRMIHRFDVNGDGVISFDESLET